MPKVKVALIVQRFGEHILGGAESHCFQLAMRLSETLDWTVHVYTTTAFSYQTWSNFYPEGEERIRNVTVFRYNVTLNRWPTIFKIFNRLVSPTLAYWGRHPKKIPRIFFPVLRLIEKLWYILQGPWCPKLIENLHHAAANYDRFIFFTYLYYPTVFGLSALAQKSVLVPLAHPEPPLSFTRVRHLLKSAPCILANTEVEKSLLLKKGLCEEENIIVVGCGLNEQFFTKPTDFPHVAIPGLKQPYITYLGRVSKGKGVFQLIQYFLQFILQNKNQDLSLVLAGENDGSVNIFYHPQIKFIGYISQDDKTSLIAHAACVVNPSPRESLSLLALEAIALQKPVLVNSRCDVLRFYARNLQTVFDFNDNAEFSEQLTRILSIRKFQEFKRQLKESQSWVKSRYSWETILAAYQKIPAPKGTRDTMIRKTHGLYKLTES